MKKMLGVSVLSAMLILGQPLMAFADGMELDNEGPRIINFADIRGIIAEQNIDYQINENDRLIGKVGFSDLKKTIKDVEDELEDIDRDRDQYRSGNRLDLVIGLGSQKRALLDTLKELERTAVDRPTMEAMIDLKATMNNDSLVRTAEGLFVAYNQLKLTTADISLGIDQLQDKLFAMQIQESLGMVTRNNVNQLTTTLVDMQTKLESTKFELDSLERQFKNLLNDEKDLFVIGSNLDTEDSSSEESNSQDSSIDDEEVIDVEEDEGVVEDEDTAEGIDNEKDDEDDDAIAGEEEEQEAVDADFEKALANSYSIILQEQQIVLLEAELERIQKDRSMSSKYYKEANYKLSNANLELTQMKNALKSEYSSKKEDIIRKQSALRLAEQGLADKKVALSEAQIKMGLGLISRLEMESVTSDYQVQENVVKTSEIELFKAEDNYNWFLKGMSLLG